MLTNNHAVIPANLPYEALRLNAQTITHDVNARLNAQHLPEGVTSLVLLPDNWAHGVNEPNPFNLTPGYYTRNEVAALLCANAFNADLVAYIGSMLEE